MKTLPLIKDLKNNIKKNKPMVVLFLISLLVVSLNYKSSTFLSGWDSLHPEFNFLEYWQRITQSVWQEHQGLGAVATQAHASEIPRMLFVLIFKLIFPLSFVRWAYFLLSLIVGPLGVYKLISYITSKYKNSETYAFVGALWYLLNLGTLQHFFVPLEMFATLYWAIGWLFLYLIKFMQENDKKSLFVFILLTIFSSPMAHTSTLWLVYMFDLSVFLLIISIYSFEKSHNLKISIRSAIIGFLSILLSLYWLLPNLYFILKHGNDVHDAKITRLFSEEAILHNQHYANIFDISILKSFLFDWSVNINGEFVKIFSPWESHMQSRLVFLAGVIVSVMILLGLFYTYSAKKRAVFLGFFSITIISIFFLLMYSPPFGFLFIQIQKISLLKEALRFPFTKFSIPLILTFAVFLSFGLHVIDYFLKLLRFKIKPLYVTTAISILIVFFAWPAFRGNLIGSIDKVQFPSEYKDTFDYINNQTVNGRIATLPANNLFGWIYYDWTDDGISNASYQGAGFTWFLSKNPILEREFDRWYPTNEQFYNEFQYAIYSKDVSLLAYVIDKYQLDYLLLDENVITPFADRSLFYSDTEELLSKSPRIKLEKQFGKLSVYSTVLTEKPLEYVYAPKNVVNTTSNYTFSNIDPFFSISTASDVFYTPISNIDNLKDNNSSNNPLFKEIESLFPDDNVLSRNLSTSDKLKVSTLPITKLHIPSFSRDLPSPAQITFNNNFVNVDYLYPSISDSLGNKIYNPFVQDKFRYESKNNDPVGVLIDNKYLEASGFSHNVFLNKDSSIAVFNKNPIFQVDLSKRIYSAVPSDCGGGYGVYGKSFDIHPGTVKLDVKDKNVCLYFPTPIENTFPVVYKIEFDYQNTPGSRPMYCIYSPSKDDCINDKYGNAPNVKENTKTGYSHYEDYFFVAEPQKVNFSLILESFDKKGKQTATYKNIKLTAFDILNVGPLTPSDKAYGTETDINIKPSQFPLTVDLSAFSVFNKDYKPGDGSYNYDKRNCDNFNQKAFDRTLTSVENSKANKYIYTATDAISCDNVKTPEINPKASYLITFDSLNKSSKGIDLCIAGQNLDKCMIVDRTNHGGENSTLVGDNGRMLESFIFPPYPVVKGVGINLGNQSIGNVPTENELYGINAKYIPYIWLKSLYGIKNENVSTNMDTSVLEVNKRSLYKYNVKTDAPVLVLNQSYEKGWGLYDTSSCLFGITTPMTCKKADATHVLAKNWANGWVINTLGVNNYVIIFWPQYLQFFGYFVLILAIITMAFVGFKKKRHRKGRK